MASASQVPARVHMELKFVGNMKDHKLKGMLDAAGVKYCKLRKDFRRDFAVLTFDTLEEGTTAKKLIEQLGLASDSGDKLELQERIEKYAKKGEKKTEVTGAEAVAPLWGKVPYHEQLQRKQKWMAKTMVKVTRELIEQEHRTEKKLLPEWLFEIPLSNKQKKGGNYAWNHLESTKNARQGQKPSESEQPAVKKARNGEDDEQADGAEENADGDEDDEPEAGQGRVQITDGRRALRERVWALDKPWEDPDFGLAIGWRGRMMGGCCELDVIRPSPLQVGYRNKTEFTIGKGADGLAIVGYRNGSFEPGAVHVGEVPVVDPSGASVTCSPSSIAVLHAVQSFLREPDRLAPYDLCDAQGHWRSLMVRHFESTKSIMIMFTLRMGQVPEEKVKAELQVITDRLKGTTLAGSLVKSISVCFSERTGQPEPASDRFELLYGDSHIYDVLNGVRFAVNAQAFFQVNSSAAEVLYSQVRDWALLPPAYPTESPPTSTVLLDVCCGTGTIGLSMAKDFSYVVGVDNNATAIEDARFNAQQLGVSDRSIFVAALAESVMRQCISRFARPEEYTDPLIKRAREILLAPGTHVTAIVDPPRAGLHQKVIRDLRECPFVDRIVYVSCNPQVSFIADAAALCRNESKQRPGIPFKPIRAIPVDLFPHTEHCELVCLFERISPNTHRGHTQRK